MVYHQEDGPRCYLAAVEGLDASRQFLEECSLLCVGFVESGVDFSVVTCGHPENLQPLKWVSNDRLDGSD